MLLLSVLRTTLHLSLLLGKEAQLSQHETGDVVWISYPHPHFSQNSHAYASGLRETNVNNQ